MTTVVLDTNIWIYLTSDSYFELWQKLKEMKENKEINIVVNDIIILEWERNRETTIKNLIDNIKREYRSAKNLASYLPSEAKIAFLKSISEYQEEKNRVKMAENRVKEVEAFMHSCNIFKVTNDQKLFVSELAINKVPPFQNNKNNSMARHLGSRTKNWKTVPPDIHSSNRPRGQGFKNQNHRQFA